MRSLLVSAAGLAVLAAYLALPTSGTSREFPLRILEDFPAEWKIYRSFPDPEKRLEIYSRLNFSILQMLREVPGDAVILFPPKEYTHRFLPPDQTHWAEPRYLYYVNYTSPGAVRRSVIWGREGTKSATVAVLLEEAEGDQIRVDLVDLREPGGWTRVEAAYRSSGASGP